MHAHHGTHLLPLCRNPGTAELARPPGAANPLGRGSRLTVRVGDADVAAEADDIAKAQIVEKREQLLVAEAAVSQDRHPTTRGHRFGQTAQAGILIVVAPGCDLLLPDGQPDQWCRSAVARHQAQYQCRLAVTIKVGPVHRDQDISLDTDLLRHPTRKAVPHVDARVAHQTVHLLDRMLGHQTPRLRQSLTDRGHGQRGAGHHAKGRTRQRIDAFCVQVRPI
jgi:hypothetical protein